MFYTYSINDVIKKVIDNAIAEYKEITAIHTTPWGLVASMVDLKSKEIEMVLWLIKQDGNVYYVRSVDLVDVEVLSYTKGIPKQFINSLSAPISNNEARFRAIVRLINN